MEKAHEVITAEDLKIFSGVPSNEIVARHVHKIVQVVYLCNFSFFFFLKALISFSGLRGKSSYHHRVPYSEGKGCVCEV